MDSLTAAVSVLLCEILPAELRIAS